MFCFISAAKATLEPLNVGWILMVRCSYNLTTPHNFARHILSDCSLPLMCAIVTLVVRAEYMRETEVPGRMREMTQVSGLGSWIRKKVERKQRLIPTRIV